MATSGFPMMRRSGAPCISLLIFGKKQARRKESIFIYRFTQRRVSLYSTIQEKSKPSHCPIYPVAVSPVTMPFCTAAPLPPLPKTSFFIILSATERRWLTDSNYRSRFARPLRSRLAARRIPPECPVTKSKAVTTLFSKRGQKLVVMYLVLHGKLCKYSLVVCPPAILFSARLCVLLVCHDSLCFGGDRPAAFIVDEVDAIAAVL